MIIRSAVVHPVSRISGLGTLPEDWDALISRWQPLQQNSYLLLKQPFLGSDLTARIQILRQNLKVLDDELSQEPSTGKVAELSTRLTYLEQQFGIMQNEAKRNGILVGLGLASVAAGGAYFIWTRTKG